MFKECQVITSRAFSNVFFSSRSSQVLNTLECNAEAHAALFSEQLVDITQDSPIYQGILSYQPFHPISSTCMYIFSMESPLKYALNRGALTSDSSLIDPLGPFAFAIKSIVQHCNNEREDVISSKFVCWTCMSATETQLTIFKNSLSQEINMLSYQEGTMEDIAIKNVISSCATPSKIPLLLEISVDSVYNIFKVNRSEFTPYYKTENKIIL